MFLYSNDTNSRAALNIVFLINTRFIIATATKIIIAATFKEIVNVQEPHPPSPVLHMYGVIDYDPGNVIEISEY